MQDDPQKSPPSVVGAAPVNPAETPVPAPADPAWAADLRKLYNSVVEEPLPDSFLALLSQLDAQD